MPAPFRQGGLGTGDTDCHSQCAHWLRNDIVFCKGCGGKQHKKTKSPPAFAKDDALHRDTTLLRRPLTRTDLMKCRHTSALLRAYPSGPNACAALGPAAPEPCSPIRSAPAFTGPGSLWRPKMGYSFLHCHFIPGENSLDAIIFSITYYIILPGRLCQCFCWVLGFGVL